MTGKTHRRGRRLIAGVVACAAALSVTVVAASGAGASVRSAKIDKNGVIKFAANMADQGGEFFWAGGFGPSQPLARSWMDQIYDTMIHPAPDGKTAPGLATKWEYPDANTVTLTLRTGVKFSDGTAFDANAVKFAWDYTFANSTNKANFPAEIKAITAVEAPNPTTVTIKMNGPFAEVLGNKELQSAYWLGVAPKAAIEAGTLNSKPIGAGPYMLDQYTKSSLITLKRNPTYWDPKAQKLAGIQFIQTTTGAPSVAALQAGTVNLARDIPPSAITTIEGGKGLKVISIPSPQTRTVNLCPTKAPFTSVDARQAVAYAIDHEAVNEAGYYGTAKPTNQLLTSLSPFYNKKYESTFKYDPKKAKELLAKAGIASGTTVNLIASNSEPYPAMVDVVTANLKAVGFNVVPLISSNLPTDVRNQVPEMTVIIGDPGFWSNQFFGQSTLNQCAWVDPAIQAALNIGRDPSKSTAERQKAWDTFIELNQQQSVFIPMIQTPNLLASTDKVQGLFSSDTIGGPVFFGVYMTK